jgi:Trk-type K+ transport system membrane component
MKKDFNLTKEVIIAFFLAAIICAVLSAVINYYAIKMPDSEIANAINHGVSGFISGGISGVAGTLITAKKLLKNKQ